MTHGTADTLCGLDNSVSYGDGYARADGRAVVHEIHGIVRGAREGMAMVMRERRMESLRQCAVDAVGKARRGGAHDGGRVRVEGAVEASKAHGETRRWRPTPMGTFARARGRPLAPEKTHTNF